MAMLSESLLPHAARRRTRVVNRRLRGVEALEQGEANAMLLGLEDADERA